jgi:nucleotide-binding universal stress UspA family protein
MSSEDREQRIRELASALWEQEGRPEGQAERHWRMAEKAVGTGPIADATLKSRPFDANASYKDILVYLDAGPYLETRLEVATALAQRHKAKLIGVDVSTEAAFEGDWRARAEQLEEIFESSARAAQIAFQYRVASQASASTFYAHSADLFIATQPHVDTEHLAFDAVPEKTLLTCGVPGLILPCNWQKRELGRRVIVAWNASREATRALHDALPILKSAELVIVFHFERRHDSATTDMEALLAHLADHGVTARVETWSDSGGMDPVSALFACLDADDVDLIVAGVYGHARWLEGLFGGVSRDLIVQDTMAALLSH